MSKSVAMLAATAASLTIGVAIYYFYFIHSKKKKDEKEKEVATPESQGKVQELGPISQPIDVKGDLPNLTIDPHPTPDVLCGSEAGSFVMVPESNELVTSKDVSNSWSTLENPRLGSPEHNDSTLLTPSYASVVAGSVKPNASSTASASSPPSSVTHEKEDHLEKHHLNLSDEVMEEMVKNVINESVSAEMNGLKVVESFATVNNEDDVTADQLVINSVESGQSSRQDSLLSGFEILKHASLPSISTSEDTSIIEQVVQSFATTANTIVSGGNDTSNSESYTTAPGSANATFEEDTSGKTSSSVESLRNQSDLTTVASSTIASSNQGFVDPTETKFFSAGFDDEAAFDSAVEYDEHVEDPAEVANSLVVKMVDSVVDLHHSIDSAQDSDVSEDEHNATWDNESDDNVSEKNLNEDDDGPIVDIDEKATGLSSAHNVKTATNTSLVEESSYSNSANSPSAVVNTGDSSESTKF